MKVGIAIKALAVFMLITAISATSGCFDIHTARQIFYPPSDDSVKMTSDMKVEAAYDFQGPMDTIGVVRLGSAEFHREIDNFRIAPGGGQLYVKVVAHFFQDPNIKFQRYINVTLSHHPSNGDPEVKVRASYSSREDAEVHVDEDVGWIVPPEPGLWSLKVEGVGTAIVSEGVTSYDWFKVNVYGLYSDRSYNHNAPDEGGSVP